MWKRRELQAVTREAEMTGPESIHGEGKHQVHCQVRSATT